MPSLLMLRPLSVFLFLLPRKVVGGIPRGIASSRPGTMLTDMDRSGGGIPRRISVMSVVVGKSPCCPAGVCYLFRGRHPVGVLLGDFHCPAGPLVAKEPFDPPTAGDREQPQFPLTGPAAEVLQHRLRLGGLQPLLLRHGSSSRFAQAQVNHPAA